MEGILLTRYFARSFQTGKISPSEPGFFKNQSSLIFKNTLQFPQVVKGISVEMEGIEPSSKNDGQPILEACSH